LIADEHHPKLVDLLALTPSFTTEKEIGDQASALRCLLLSPLLSEGSRKEEEEEQTSSVGNVRFSIYLSDGKQENEKRKR
jgi:hypothetical protein